MDFNEWYEKRDRLLKVSGYNGNTTEYFDKLKDRVDHLGLNEGMKYVYPKRHGPYGLEKLFFFYEEKITVVSLNSIEIYVDDLYLSNLKNLRFKFILNPGYQDKLLLNFNDRKIVLEPRQDTEEAEHQKYIALLKEIYLFLNG